MEEERRPLWISVIVPVYNTVDLLQGVWIPYAGRLTGIWKLFWWMTVLPITAVLWRKSLH